MTGAFRPQYFWLDGRRLKVLHNGSDAVELVATPYRQEKRPRVWKGNFDGLVVSPMMLFNLVRYELGAAPTAEDEVTARCPWSSVALPYDPESGLEDGDAWAYQQYPRVPGGFGEDLLNLPPWTFGSKKADAAWVRLRTRHFHDCLEAAGGFLVNRLGEMTIRVSAYRTDEKGLLVSTDPEDVQRAPAPLRLVARLAGDDHGVSPKVQS